MRARAGNDRGQGVVLVLVVVTLVVVVMVAVARFGNRVISSQQAQAAADAAALAGVVDGRIAAARLAEANGGVLRSFVAVGDDVIVVVEVAGERATARATRAP